MKASFISFVAGAAALAAGGAAFAQKACVLVSQAEAQAISSGKVGNGNESSIPAMNMSSCSYLGSGKDSTPSVLVTVSDTTKIYAGMDNATVKTTVFGRTDKDTTPIPGIGEAANYMQVSATKGAAKALVKGKIVSVEYEAADAVAKKDQVIGVLKTAVSRISK
jgi:hypothetical protein